MAFVMQAAGSDPLFTFLQYGIAGIVLVMVVTGQLWPKPAVEELRRRQDEERKAWYEERKAWYTELLPRIQALVNAAQETSREVKVNQNELTELSDLVRRLVDAR